MLSIILLSISSTDSSWIGAKDDMEEGIWRWASDNSLAGHYSRQIGGMNFSGGQPNNNNGIEYCAAIHQGKITDEDCKIRIPYLCELPGSFALLFTTFL